MDGNHIEITCNNKLGRKYSGVNSRQGLKIERGENEHKIKAKLLKY
jgi:hypothetical protein